MGFDPGFVGYLLLVSEGFGFSAMHHAHGGDSGDIWLAAERAYGCTRSELDGIRRERDEEASDLILRRAQR